MRRFFGPTTYANVASTLALVLVLGGVAYAAATLPRNSVGTRQLKDNAVKSKKVDNGTLLLKDIKAGQVDRPNAKRWTSHMDANDAPKLVAKIPGMELRTECATSAAGGPSVGDDNLVPYVQFKATVDGVNYYSNNGTDVDMEAGQVIGAVYWLHPSTVDGAQTGIYRESFWAVLPSGAGVVGEVLVVANRGSSDCSFFARLELY